MNKVLAESISTFGQSGHVSPSEQVYVLSSIQLQDIITRAVLEATEPLYQEIAYDRQRIAKLEQNGPGPHQKDRIEILRALLASNGGKMPLKVARQKMRLSESQFSKLLTLAQEYVETKPYHLRKNQKILVQVLSGNKKVV